MNKNIRTHMFDGLSAILGDGGAAFKGTHFVASASQCDYSQHVTEAIVRSAENKKANPCSPASIILSSADTGTGKTVGYGVPLLLKAALSKSRGELNKKVVISTHSHALQRQFFGTPDNPGDILKISRWIYDLSGCDLRIARRLGRQAFISSSALSALIYQLKSDRSLGLSAFDFESLEPLMAFAEESNNGQNSGLIEDVRAAYGGRLPFGITASSICLSSDSDDMDSLAYDEHLINAQNADVVIVSHAYLASCAMYRNGTIGDGGVDCLVIDEADRLADVAGSAFKSEISLLRSASSLGRMPGEAAKEASGAIETLAKFTQTLYSKQEAVTLSELPARSREKLLDLALQASTYVSKVVVSATKSLHVAKDDLDDLQRYELILDRFVSSAKRQDQMGVNSKDLYAAAISFSPVKSCPSLVVIPVDPGRIIARLWNLRNDPQIGNLDHKSSPVNCVLLTSATLGAPGHYADAVSRFKVIARELGVSTKPQTFQKPELDLWSYFEPENFGAVKFILAPPSTPNPTLGLDDDARSVLNEDWLNYTVTMINTAKAAGGRTLVLCTSYKDTRILSEMLLQKGTHVIEQVRGQSTDDCVEAFLADGNAVWITPTAWEGLNLPGAIANLVIPRIPFFGISPIDRALLKAYGNLTDKSVESIVSASMMNATKRKLRQGMFRPIRSRTDQARIWSADPRFPMHPLSQIPLRHPGEIKYSGARSYPSFHAVVPGRFQRALVNAEILKNNGKLLK